MMRTLVAVLAFLASTSGNVAAAAPDATAPDQAADLPDEDPAGADLTQAGDSPDRRGWLSLPGELSSQGELAFEGRAFRDDALANTTDKSAGLLGRMEWRHEHDAFEQRLRAYGRLDHYDKRRSVLVVEEAWMQVRRGRLRLRAGVDLVNWTATEAFHPADVINARNLDSDLE